MLIGVSGDRNRRLLPKGVKAWSVRRGFAGRIADCCEFRHGCDAFVNLRYHFQVYNDRIVITSVKSGDIVGELYLGLIERTDSNGVRSRNFKYEG